MADAEKTRRRFEVEIHRRIASPVACLLFFFVSFPLGLVVKRSGKGAGFVLALVFLIIYYFFYFAGIEEANHGRVPAVFGAWLPNMVIGGIGLYIMSTRTDDFAPFAFISKPVRRFYKNHLAARVDPVIFRIEAVYKGSIVYRGLSAARRGVETLISRFRKKTD